jgi:cardiolipin synthase
VECDHGPPEPTRSGPAIDDPGDLDPSGPLHPSVQRAIAAISGQEALPGHAVRVLSDGVESFGEMLTLVRSAAREVRFENFIFRADAVGTAFARELRRRSEDGLRVRVLHDPVGSLMARRRPAGWLFRGSGVESRLFNLALPTGRSRLLGRDHRKLTVADRRSFVTGGICLADPWAGNCVRRCTWRDSAVRVDGPAAAVAARMFDETWSRGVHARRPGARSASPAARSAKLAGSVPVRILADLGPDRVTGPTLERVLDAAEHEALITNPYFIPPPSLLGAMLRAVGRGVRLRLLLPGTNNHPVAALAGEERLGDLLRAGTEVFRWRGAMIHAKSVVVDGRWALIGSSNLDALSLHRNAELNVEIHGSAVGTRMTRLFLQDLENSEAYTLADWHARGPARRLAARAAGVFAPWL